MIKARDRLDSHSVKEVFEKGKRRSGKNFSVSFISSSGRSGFAVTVSKKIAPKAVVRNKIRRRIYSALREARDFLPRARIVIVPKKSILEISFEDLKKEICDTIR